MLSHKQVLGLWRAAAESRSYLSLLWEGVLVGRGPPGVSQGPPLCLGPPSQSDPMPLPLCLGSPAGAPCGHMLLDRQPQL